MRREDLKNWTREQMKSEILRLHRKLELFGIKFEENPNNFSFSHNGNRYYAGKLVNDYVALKEENAELKERVKEQREKIDSLLKELEEEKGKTITISDGAITMRADMWEVLNENKAFKDENTTLKQRIKDLEDIGNNYEPQFAPDDDISAFNFECVKQWTTEMGCKRKIQELQGQHQQDCIRYNDMRTAYLVTLDELARLRERFGVGR